MKKELSERKQKILQAVVDEYITTAEPVSSGEIKEKYLADISSATIRNELASLEEMGYLVQPHVSAGRVPLPQAYKLYVDKVMNGKSLSKNEISFIKDKFSERMDRVEDIIEKTAKVISDVTNYTSVVVVKNFKDVKVSEIKLVPIGDETALVIIITDRGVLRDKTIEIDKADDDIGAYVQSATMLLNRMFAGKTVKEILKPDKIIKEEIEGFRTIFEEVIDVLTKYDKEESGLYRRHAENAGLSGNRRYERREKVFVGCRQSRKTDKPYRKRRRYGVFGENRQGRSGRHGKVRGRQREI